MDIIKLKTKVEFFYKNLYKKDNKKNIYIRNKYKNRDNTYNNKLINFKLLIIFLLLLLLLLLFFNCSFKTYDYVFYNFSNYEVTISPDNQDWDTFIIIPDEKKTISIPYDQIKFYYNNSLYVDIDTSESGIIKIFNKTLLYIQNSSSCDLILVRWNGIFFR